MAQIMPRTFVEASRGIPIALSPFDAKTSIQIGAIYMAQRRLGWNPAKRTPEERNELGQASYNAGMGNILKAQKLCADAKLWKDISPCLQAVTGDKFSRETLGYVKNIRRWKEAIE